METKTVVVGSPEDKKAKKERLRRRVDQAMKRIADEGSFSPKQIAALQMSFTLILWGIEDTI